MEVLGCSALADRGVELSGHDCVFLTSAVASLWAFVASLFLKVEFSHFLVSVYDLQVSGV